MIEKYLGTKKSVEHYDCQNTCLTAHFSPLDSNSDIRENCLSYKLEKRAVANDIWPFYTVFLSVTGSWQSFLQERQQTFMTTMTSFKRHFRPSRVNHGKKQVLKRSSKAKKVPAHHCQAGEL